MTEPTDHEPALTVEDILNPTRNDPPPYEPTPTEAKVNGDSLGQRDTESEIIVDETIAIIHHAKMSHDALDDATTARIHAVVQSQAMLAEQIARVANSLERMEMIATDAADSEASA